MQTPDPCMQLRHLLESGALTQAHQRTGDRLLRRLGADISVVLAGPEADAKRYLEQVLTASDLPRTTFRMVGWQDTFDFAHADVCIWCTTEFSAGEAGIWQGAPDWLKDHSFLVAVSENGAAGGQSGQAAFSALENVAAEEFYGLFPIDLPDQARDPNADALIREVAKLVQTGLRADADNAEMFIQRHQSKLPSGSLATPPKATPVPAPQPALNAVYEKALGAMRNHFADLEPLMNTQDEGEMNDILSICAETSEAVADVLAGADSVDPMFATILEETQSIADRILLMSVEGGVAPAVDAVTCVLQLRREMELQIAC